MAYALRSYYEQENNHGVLDRIEIYEDGFSGTTIELEGRFPCAFDFEHREITSEQKEYLSLFENQIIMGVLDLYAYIDTDAKKTLVTDIADAPAKQFRLEWKRDGTTVWYGYPHGRIIQYPEENKYMAKIQFRDFEFLKGKDYPIEDQRQKIEQTFREIVGEIALLSTSFPLRTITSWQEENTTVSDDFLNQVYHDTYVLREYASDGYSTDQNISYYEALRRIADPMLVIYQWKGVNVFQISGLKDPSDVLLSTYNLLGQLTSASADIRQTIYTNTGSGLPAANVITNNTSYPALRKVVYDFKHQSGSSDFEFDLVEDITYRDEVEFDGRHYISSQEYGGNGDEQINFVGFFDTSEETDQAPFAIHVGAYALDSDFTFKTVADHSGVSNTVSSVDTLNDRLNISANLFNVGDPVLLESTGTLPSPLTNITVYYIIAKDDSTDWIQLSDSPDGSAVDLTDAGSGAITVKVITVYIDTEVRLTYYEAMLSFLSGAIPAVSNSEIEIILMLNSGLADDSWFNMRVFIQNPTQAGESIEYRLTQDQLYPEELRLPDGYFGDGPYTYSKSSYRTSLSLNDITTGWRRRGEVTYGPYSKLKLREVLDYQRFRQLKKQFQLWGEFNPISVSVYESENYMYVGGKYNGRWHPVGVKIEENLDV